MRALLRLFAANLRLRLSERRHARTTTYVGYDVVERLGRL